MCSRLSLRSSTATSFSSRIVVVRVAREAARRQQHRLAARGGRTAGARCACAGTRSLEVRQPPRDGDAEPGRRRRVCGVEVGAAPPRGSRCAARRSSPSIVAVTTSLCSGGTTHLDALALHRAEVEDVLLAAAARPADERTRRRTRSAGRRARRCRRRRRAAAAAPPRKRSPREPHQPCGLDEHEARAAARSRFFSDLRREVVRRDHVLADRVERAVVAATRAGCATGRRPG